MEIALPKIKPEDLPKYTVEDFLHGLYTLNPPSNQLNFQLGNGVFRFTQFRRPPQTPNLSRYGWVEDPITKRMIYTGTV
jgi:hypothetical protein